MTGVLGYTATVLFIILLVPQYIKTYRLRNVEGVSILTCIVMLIANVIALAYAFLIEENPLIIKYAISIVVVAAYIILYFKVRSLK